MISGRGDPTAPPGRRVDSLVLVLVLVLLVGTVLLPGCGFPDASSTGPSGSLAPSGSITTSFAGQVIENLDISGEVRVQHDDVTIRNVRIRSQGGHAIYILGNRDLVVEDCELDGQGRNATSAIAEHNYTMRRCEVHGFGEGPRINGNVVLEDNFIHGFVNFVAQGAHQDCIQATSGWNIVIRGNTCVIDVDGANAAIYFATSSGGNVLIEGNLIGGGTYALYCGDDLYSGVTVRDNHFTTQVWPNGGWAGPTAYCAQANKSGNVWHDGPRAGQPVT